MEISISSNSAKALITATRQPPSSPDLVQRLATWIQRSRGRRALEDLDQRLLMDIGVSRADALREAAKHFWTA